MAADGKIVQLPVALAWLSNSVLGSAGHLVTHPLMNGLANSSSIAATAKSSNFPTLHLTSFEQNIVTEEMTQPVVMQPPNL